MTVIDQIGDLFARRGAAAYHGEAVSQAEHALQAADIAEREGATDDLVVAALLHDIGHLLEGQDEDLAARGVDGRHEAAGSAWLARHFSPNVTEPIRLHVAAKRYLCAVDPSYCDGLSPASRLSLSLQGGHMTGQEIAEFETNPAHANAVQLRRWDDAAKVPGADVPGLGHYRDRLLRVVSGG
jgi:gamma-butyrobetaine dioxygenase